MARKEILELATKRHCREVARNLSLACEIGLRARHWTEAERFARAMLNRSVEAYALRAPDGDLLALYGLTVTGMEVAGPWCLTTRHFRKHSVIAWTMAKETLMAWRSMYPLISFHVHAKDEQGLRMCKHLGLDVGVPVLVEGREEFFHKIVVQTKKLEVA